MAKLTLLMIILFSVSCSSHDYRPGAESGLPASSNLNVRTIAVIQETGEDFFSGIRGMAITSEGELLVNDRGTQAFFLFDLDGNYKGKTGNEGRGPGEFADIRHFLLTPDDVLHVFDRNNSRHQILVKEEDNWRQKTETELIQLQSESIHSFFPEEIMDMDVRDGEKTYLALFRNNIGFRDTTTVYHEWLDWVDEQMKPVNDEKLFLDYAEASVTVRTENSISVSTHPAGFRRFLKYHRDNSMVLFANGETGEIKAEGLEQNLSRSIQLPVEIVPVNNNDKSDYLTNIRRSYGQQGANRANELYLDHEPVIQQFVLADDGKYWIKTARLNPDTPDWIVVDSTGGITGSFHTRQIHEDVRGYRLHAVTGNKMYGSGWIDEIPNLIISEITETAD
jgi:hypothetical protein